MKIVPPFTEELFEMMNSIVKLVVAERVAKFVPAVKLMSAVKALDSMRLDCPNDVLIEPISDWLDEKVFSVVDPPGIVGFPPVVVTAGV
jgi:hypothetical protein